MNLIPYLWEHNRILNIVGIVCIIFIAMIFSRKRCAINGKAIINALIMQFVIGFCMLRTNVGHAVVHAVAEGVQKLYESADQGSAFVFGSLVDQSQPWGFVFALKVLPIIIFFGALMSLLFYIGIVQRIVALINVVIRPLLGTSGAETLCAIANSFLGQTEAPLLVRNYLGSMTQSEMFLVMVSGMGTISGSILAVFGAMGVPVVHLLTASVMAIPSTIMIAKIVYPETEKAQTAGGVNVYMQSPARNMLDAIATGTTDGLYLALNVAAMLIAFISLIWLGNNLLVAGSLYVQQLLDFFGYTISFPILSLNTIFGYIFAPFGYLLGFSGKEALLAGQLLGIKVSVNELIAYSNMLTMQLSERTIAIMTYALCGFANFSCIGIQIGGIGSLVPEKRHWLSQLGLLAVLGSSLSNLLSAMIVSLLI